jgi:predicted O-methyltransferase YrrM
MSNLLPLNDKLYQYILENSLREHPALTALDKKTRELPEAKMVTLPEQRQFLAFLIELMGAKRVVEIGVFTGCGTLAMAQAMPSDGKLIACDISEQWPAIGKPYWQEAGVANKIELHIGDAATTLEQMLVKGAQGEFDFIFIDADKERYNTYYELGLRLLRTGGLMVFDNMLWGGDVAKKRVTDPQTTAIRNLNAKMHKDPRVAFSLIPLADGVALARKR